MNDHLNRNEDQALEALFAAARAEQTAVSSDLMARILADAAAAATERHLQPEPARPGLVATIWAALGGWGGAGGLAMATAAGVWIGVAPPSGLETVTSAVFGSSESLSLFASDDILGVEG